MNRLTVVIVNYNSRPYLETCLESIQRETKTSGLGIVVVDNASRENDFSPLQRAYPEVVFLKNSENRGFSKACNQGLKHLPAQFYLLLNPDTVIQDSAIDRTLEFLTSNPRAGIAGCRITNPDGSLQKAARRTVPTPRTAAFRFLGLAWLFPRSRWFGRYNLTHLDENQTYPVEAVSGSFMMFRNELLQDLGGLDEDFFLYGEDLDFCYRALRRGWKTYYFHGASVIHHRRHSWDQAGSPAAFHFYEAMKIFYRKHYAGQSGFLENAFVSVTIAFLYRVHLLRQLLRGK